MDAALDLFREHGFKEVSIDQIGKRSSITRLTFYRLYFSKDEMAYE